MPNNEYVVLVNNRGQQIGTAVKADVHTDKTPLHRAFSLFLFNDRGEVLVQQRALTKKTWPGIWSNSCCGHPMPEETTQAAIHRRVQEELTARVTRLQKVADYRYRFELQGVVENEICPVYRGLSQGSIQPNPLEVHAYRWVNWSDWLAELKTDFANTWSPWCKEEVRLFA